MNGCEINPWPAFPVKYAITLDKEGGMAPVVVDERDVIATVKEEAIVSQILKYCYRQLCGNKEAEITQASAVEAMKFWRDSTDAIDDIAMVREKSEKGYCWSRMPWDIEAGETPTFDELFSRMENKDAVLAWIGSLFVMDSDRSQYVWIHGEGGNGKGRLANFLAKVLGPSYRPEQVPGRDDRFWTSGLVGSRLVAFTDCNRFGFPTSGLFKSLTGDDMHRVERKGKDVGSVALPCKFLFLSNQKPTLSGSEADRRRAIYAEIAPVPPSAIMPTMAYDKLLWKEGPAFIHKAKEKYFETTGSGRGVIPTDRAIFDELIEANEAGMDYLFEKHFVISEDAELPANELQRILRDVEKMPSTHKQKDFIEWFMRYHKIKKVRKRNGSRRYVAYKGLGLKIPGPNCDNAPY
jgi:hypothetical protein